MNNKRSIFEQLMISMILAWAGVWIMQTYFNPAKAPKTPDRVVPKQALVEAFKGIQPASGPALTKDAATAEVKKLQDEVQKNEKDDYSRWARLRIGLIQQYILNDLPVDERKTGFLGLGPKMQYIKPYDEVTAGGHHDALTAQALYQTGDLFWRKSLAAPDRKGEQEAVSAFETIVADERASKDFGASEIFVPREKDPAKIPVGEIPAGGFEQVKVQDLRGSLADPNPRGVLDRINESYRETPLFKLFDGIVRALGANPVFSYGLAVLIFAVCTRILMQPLSKKQYESMKGMALIAPEMKKIQERYKNKSDQESQMKMVKEIQELQRRHGVNPYMGCVLAFVQMPIFFFVVYPMIKHYQPKMDLAGASFLWINSLSHPDIILLVLYGLSMFVSFRLSSTPPTDDSQRKMQIMMSFMMPIFLPFFLITYPSAFVLYWMTFNLMSTMFQWRMMKAADPKKNIIKTLMGEELRASLPAAPADAVPPRPKDGKGGGPKLSKGDAPEKAKANGSQPGSKDAESGLNGHLNGKSSSGMEPAGGKKKKK